MILFLALNAATAALLAEVVAEGLGDVTPAPIAGQVVRVKNPRDWYTAAMSALQVGDFEAWAEDALAGDDYDKVWCQVNSGRGPTNGDVEDFFDAYRQATGADPGKSRDLRRSLRRTGRR